MLAAPTRPMVVPLAAPPHPPSRSYGESASAPALNRIKFSRWQKNYPYRVCVRRRFDCFEFKN